MLTAPYVEIKRIVSNYLTQRDLTKEYSIGTNLDRIEIGLLNELVTERDTTIAKAGREIIAWQKDWNEQIVINEKCRAKVQKRGRSALAVGCGCLILGFAAGAALKK